MFLLNWIYLYQSITIHIFQYDTLLLRLYNTIIHDVLAKK